MPVAAVLEPVLLARQDFMVARDDEPPQALRESLPVPWLKTDDVHALVEEYVEDSGLFRSLHAPRPWEPADLYVRLRPQVTFRQYVQPSGEGHLLTLGTAGLYALLGGSANFRTGEC